MSAIQVMLSKARRIGICLLLHCFAISFKKKDQYQFTAIEYCARDSSVKQTDKKDENKTFPIDSKRRTNSHSTLLLRIFLFHFSHSHTLTSIQRQKNSPNPEDMDRHSSGSSTSIQGKSIKSIKLITPINFTVMKMNFHRFYFLLSLYFISANICLFLLFSVFFLFFGEQMKIELNFCT